MKCAIQINLPWLGRGGGGSWAEGDLGLSTLAAAPATDYRYVEVNGWMEQMSSGG